jgi:hypothetical protein
VQVQVLSIDSNKRCATPGDTKQADATAMSAQTVVRR